MQMNYARMSGHYEGFLNGLSFGLDLLANRLPYISQEKAVKELQDLAEEIKQRIEKVNKECAQ